LRKIIEREKKINKYEKFCCNSAELLYNDFEQNPINLISLANKMMQCERVINFCLVQHIEDKFELGN